MFHFFPVLFNVIVGYRVSLVIFVSAILDRVLARLNKAGVVHGDRRRRRPARSRDASPLRVPGTVESYGTHAMFVFMEPPAIFVSVGLYARRYRGRRGREAVVPGLGLEFVLVVAGVILWPGFNPSAARPSSSGVGRWRTHVFFLSILYALFPSSRTVRNMSCPSLSLSKLRRMR